MTDMKKLCDIEYNPRYVFDPSIYHFTDTKTGKTYCEYNLDEVVEILNKQEITIDKWQRVSRVRQKHIDAIIEALNEEIDKADGELKAALIRISRRELEY